MTETAARRIKKLRISKGLSLAEMSKIVDLPKEHYRRLEEDSRVNYSTSDLRKIADYHNVSIDYLSVRTDDQTDYFGLPDDLQDEIKKLIENYHNSNVIY